MKPILITLTFTLATLTVASALVSKSSNSVLDHTVVLSDNNPPPICPPICSNDPSADDVIRRPPGK
jgi:hypothetical protein